MTAKLCISACIITRNEADRLEECLASLAFCDDIVVVDSHSTDDTAAIARNFGARVIARDFSGYRSQKQFAIEQARHNWILSLDADERITVSLKEEILATFSRGQGDCVGYDMPRCTRYFGRWIRHGNWYPDRKLRLFDRRHGEWSGAEVHERVRSRGKLGHFRHDIAHEAYRDLGDQQRRLSRYARMMAEHMHARGQGASLPRLVLSPSWRFFRGYLLRGGLLDGWRGLAIAWLDANYAFDKVLRLRLLNEGCPAGPAWGDSDDR